MTLFGYSNRVRVRVSYPNKLSILHRRQLLEPSLPPSPRGLLLYSSLASADVKLRTTFGRPLPSTGPARRGATLPLLSVSDGGAHEGGEDQECPSGRWMTTPQ
jgi:hypothetical protein